FLRKEHNSPLGGEVRFKLLEILDIDPKEKKRLGTYGFIQGAQSFIIGAATKSVYDLENFGYIMEELILFATGLGLTTCWVGGTLKRSRFAAQINATESEKVPAISPVGYPARNRSKVDKVVKWAARANKRCSWDILFFEGDFKRPLTRKRAGKYATPLEMIRLAPSASNRQPWRIIKECDNQKYNFFIYRKKSWYSRLLSLPDFQRVDLGIAVCHFDLVTQELAIQGNWKIIRPEVVTPTNFEYVISWIGEQ
ncbi:MAG: nitroreductase family protein, partial [Candidatus Hodarchaeales archaeon]